MANKLFMFKNKNIYFKIYLNLKNNIFNKRNYQCERFFYLKYVNNLIEVKLTN
jgi:hypothetical protein